MEEAAAEAGRRASLSEAAVLALERYAWPGNVRELQNALRRAVALADREVLTAADLRLDGPPSAAAPAAEPGGDAAVLDSLRRHGFDMQATAGALGWDRSTVTQRLKGLGFRALVEAGGNRGQAALALAGDPALARTVEVKLGEYHEHLLRSVAGFDSAEAAIDGLPAPVQESARAALPLARRPWSARPSPGSRFPARGRCGDAGRSPHAVAAKYAKPIESGRGSGVALPAPSRRNTP